MALEESILSVLRAEKVSESAIEKLDSAGYDTEDVLRLVGREGLEAEGIRPADCLKIKKAFPSSSGTVSAALSVEGSETQTPAPDFQHLLTGSDSAIGLNASALNPNINPQFVRRAGQAVMAYVLSGTGFAAVFDGRFFERFPIEDFALRERIDSWTQARLAAELISQNANDGLLEQVPLLFGPGTDRLISSAAKLFASTQSLELVGSQARIDVGGDANGYASLSQLIPFVAEEISQKMIRSRMPEHASRSIKMLADLTEILKTPLLQSYGGVVNPKSGDEGAIRFLQNQFDSDIANKFRLAVAYERLIAALAECPSGDVPAQYLKIIGILSNTLRNLFSLAVPSNGAEQEIFPFTNISLLVKGAEPAAPAKKYDVPPVQSGEPSDVKIWREKLQFFLDASATETGAARRFELEKGIEDCIANIKRRLEELAKERQRQSARYPASGWPFSSFNTPIPAKDQMTVPFLIGPSSRPIDRCTVTTVICGAINLDRTTVTNFIYLGTGSGTSLDRCPITNLYCEPNKEPPMDRCPVVNTIYKSRAELIELAKQQAALFGIELS